MTNQFNDSIHGAVVTHFLSLERWSFLKANKERFETFTKIMMPLFVEKISEFGDIVDLTETAFKMSHFYEICKSRNIKIQISEKSEFRSQNAKKPDGFYMVGRNIDLIWIKSGLNVKFRRHVAAHELAHFSLHRDAMMKREPLPASAFFRNTKCDADIFAELEADLMASLMIVSKNFSEVRNA